MPYLGPMEPGTPAHPAPQYSGGYGPPIDGYGYPTGPQQPVEDARPAGPKQGRPGLIALTALLVEVVIIAAAFNQAVSKHIYNYASGHRQSEFLTNAVASGLMYSWRVTTPSSGTESGFFLTRHIVLGELVMIGSVFLLTVLLVLAVVRGPITWARAFFGVWMAVIVATGGARIAAVAASDSLVTSRVDRGTDAVFAGPSGYSFFAGAALGFVVALITSLVAVASRRPPALVAVPASGPDPGIGVPPETPPPYYGEGRQGGWQPDRGPAPDAVTTAYPALNSEPGRGGWQAEPTRSDTTAQLPVTDTARRSSPDDQQTASYPLPPDDESLDYHADPERD